MAAHVRTPVYEGPFDVLLQLVSEHKLDVYDIPLADVVDAFVRQLPEAQPLDLEVCSEFLVIAAVLVEFKSRALLPGPDDVEDDEELSGFEERDRLLARLYELQAYAAAADAFAVLIEHAGRSVARAAGLEEQFRDAAPDLLAGTTSEQLAAAYLVATAQQPVAGLDLSHVTVEAVTVSEAVAELEDRLPGEGTVGFRQLTRHCTTRMQVIVRFLALLELCKRGWVTLDQGTTFGDLVVTWIGGAREPRTVAMAGSVEEYDG
ncbi:MAG TPA: segregation/condensation protein A [Acidimicrobiaceae bacterium]|nr:segregation/condensation protein A [Acidimicrobiaceae bacterium]